MQNPTVYQIELHRLADSPSQPRSVYSGLDELAASIRQSGVLQPILCRPITHQQIGADPEQDLEIVAGHRRVRAAELAELAEIPAIIRPMTDLEVLQVQIIENLQREDVSPLDEARAYAALRDGHGQTSAQIAATIGTSVRHVLARISLTKLTGAALEALRDGRIGAEIGVLISALPPTLHDRAVHLVRILDDEGNYRTVSLRSARTILRTQKLVVPIMSAPFDILAPRLIDCAGACTACPSNTTNMDDQAQSDLGADICTNPTCYAAKLAAHTQRELGNLADNGWTVLGEEPAFGTWWQLEGERLDNIAKAISIDPSMRAHCVAWPYAVTGLHATGVTKAGYSAMLRLIYPAPPPAAPRTTPEGGGGDDEEEETTVATKRDTSDQEPTTLAHEGGKGARESMLTEIAKAVLEGAGLPYTRADLVMTCAALACSAPLEALKLAGLDLPGAITAGALIDEIQTWDNARTSKTLVMLAITSVVDELTGDRQLSFLSQLHARYLGGEGDKTSHGSAVENQEDQPSPRAGDEVSDEAPLTGREVMDDAGASARPTAKVAALMEHAYQIGLNEAGLSTSEVVEKIQALKSGLSIDDRDAVDEAFTRGYFERKKTDQYPEPEATKPQQKKCSAARYRCPSTGQTWSGRGLKPRWLVQAIEDGKSLEDFDAEARA